MYHCNENLLLLHVKFHKLINSITVTKRFNPKKIFIGIDH